LTSPQPLPAFRIRPSINSIAPSVEHRLDLDTVWPNDDDGHRPGGRSTTHPDAAAPRHRFGLRRLGRRPCPRRFLLGRPEATTTAATASADDFAGRDHRVATRGDRLPINRAGVGGSEYLVGNRLKDLLLIRAAGFGGLV